MKKIKKLTAILVIVALTACNNAYIEGAWVESISEMPDIQQGFILEKNGNVSSINIANWKYKTWNKESNLLLLSGVKIENHQDKPFTDTLTIEKLTKDSLVLKKAEQFLRYSKAKEVETKKDLPTLHNLPVKERQLVKGELVIGHEVRSFTAEGDTTDYWIEDETGELMQKYDNITKGIKNGEPVYVELEIINLGKTDEGFAAEYASVYKIMKINKISSK